MSAPKVVVLGAGPAGLGAAYFLARSGKGEPVLIEGAKVVGGNSGTFLLEGVHCDYGSHRLHPASEPHILRTIQDLLGPELLLRPRHGRIRLKGKWIHFPLKLGDLLLRLPKGFAAALLYDMVTKPLRKVRGEPTFASILYRGLGGAMCRGFYFPYMQKLWALPPEQLAVTLAQRRVSGSSITKILRKILAQLPMFRAETTGKFFYPRRGFGQIGDALRDAAEASGTRTLLETRVTRIEHRDGRVVAVVAQQGDAEVREESAVIWSTLPVTTVVRAMDPPAPAEVLAAADRIAFRGMILIYLVLEQDQFTEYDAHYLPELNVPISRLSEPKNYSASTTPDGVTVLCAELPCDPHEPLWRKTDDELGIEMCRWLGDVGLPVTAKVRRTVTRRLSHAYPVYDRGFAANLGIVENWLDSIKGLLIFGRQGLFAHDNTHHALFMADAAVDSLQPDGSIDSAKWAEYRKVFETHVVED